MQLYLTEQKVKLDKELKQLETAELLYLLTQRLRPAPLGGALAYSS